MSVVNRMENTMTNENETIDETVADMKEYLDAIASDLDDVLDLAAYLQDDYSMKLPIVRAFRQWRAGQLDDSKFLERLRGDDLAPALRYEKAPPTNGLVILNRHRNQAQSAAGRVARGLHSEPGPHCVECGVRLTDAEAAAQPPDHDEVCAACGGPSPIT